MTDAGGGFPELPGRYRPLRRLGAGGAADVILVEDAAAEPSRKAIKILRRDTPASSLGGFRAEFRILASLEHPGLSRVYEFGDLPDGGAYYTTDFIEGRELGGGEPRSVRDVCVATAAVCRTLAYLHARGTCHNDVKPANIVVPSGEGPEGARLLDFGLAALERVGARTVAGTPGYIAPERLRGERWDGRADLYSIGATIYRVLGGRRPMTSDDPQQALAELQRRTPVGELRPGLPPALVALVEQLLADNPSARPRHAGQVIVRLGEAVGEVLPLETPGSARCHALASVLFGRQEEMERARTLVASAASGGGPRLLAVVGSAGLGKSRLLREIAHEIETEGWQVASATAAERHDPAAALRGLGAQLGSADDRLAAGGDDAALALLAAAGVGGRRVALVVDDLHRASQATIGALLSVARRACREALPVVVLAALDEAELPPEVGGLLRVAELGGQAAVLRLGSLSPEALRSMVDSLFGPGVIPAGLLDPIAARSAGSPLLVEELVRELVETGAIRRGPGGWAAAPQAARAAHATSPRLEDFLRRRCQDLGADDRLALAALGALGGAGSAEAVAETAGASVDAPVAVARLLERSLITREGAELRLQHDLLAEIALGSLAAPERTALCRRAAQLLAARGASDAELARAFAAAGEPRRAFEHALRGGERAHDAGEGRSAVLLLEKAEGLARAAGVAPGDLARPLRLLSESLFMTGRIPDSGRAAERAFAAAPEGDPERLRTAMLVVRQAVMEGDAVSAERWLGEGRRLLGPGDHFGAAQVAWGAAGLAAVGKRLRAARDECRIALEEIDRADLDDPEIGAMRCRILIRLASLETSFDLGEASRLLARAVAEAERLGDRYLRAIAVGETSLVAMMRFDLGESHRLLLEVLDGAERLGNLHPLYGAVANLVRVENARGDDEATRARVAELGRMAQAATSLSWFVDLVLSELAYDNGDLVEAGSRAAGMLPRPMPWQNVVLYCRIAAAGAAERGAVDEAGAHATRAEEEAAIADSPARHAQAAAARGYAVAAADPAAGGHALTRAAERFETLGRRDHQVALWRDAGRFLARGGDRAAADQCFDRALALCRASGAAGLAARMDAWRGRAAAPPADAGVASLPVEPAFGPMTKPTTTGDRPSARRSEEASRLLELTIGPVEIQHGFPELVGRGAAMQKVLSLLDRLADSDATVLISGETGTGKEVFARALHAASPRASGPFVGFNCAAVPPALFESELFGAMRGAFTGAVRDRTGFAQQAHGGTLLLDEVGELTLDIQPKLLRFLQDRRVRPVGADRDTAVDVRIVAATNRDLGPAVTEKRFRQDLYYRLAVVEIHVPPLRDRSSDIPDLCRHLLAQHGRADQVFTEGALAALAAYEWPGNIRELENEIVRASLLAGGGTIQKRHLSRTLALTTMVGPARRPGTLAEVERQHILATLKRVAGNRTRAAEELGLTRVGLQLKLKRMGLKGVFQPARRRSR